MSPDTIKNILKDRTMGLFSEEWYIETSEIIVNQNTPAEDDIGYVYIIKAVSNNLIKIGKSKSVQKRLNDIRGYVGDIFVLAIIECSGYGLVEKKLHEKYSKYKRHGEWFFINDTYELTKDVISLNGFLINKKFKNGVNVLSPEFLNNMSSMQSGLPFDVEDYFDQIKLYKEGVYDKNIVYNNIPFEHTYSQRKITSLMRRYIVSKGLRFLEKKSGSKRTITVLF